MPRLKSTNNAETTITTGIAPTDTSFTVNDSSAFPDAPFRATIDAEIIEVGAINRSTNTFSSILRGQENTVAASHDAGTAIQNRFTAGTYSELATESSVTTVSNNLATHTADKANPHAVTATQVGAYGKSETYTKTEVDNKVAASAYVQTALWTGTAYPNPGYVITPTKALSACRYGWMLVWSDYDNATGTANDNDFAVSFIPKYIGANFSGKIMMFTVPNFVAAPDTNSFIIKRLTVTNTTITGETENNTTGEWQDVVLRRILEW